eukprot:g5066.t1
MSTLGQRQMIQVHQNTVNRIAKDGLRPREWIFNTRTKLRPGLYQEYVNDYKLLDSVFVFAKPLDPGKVAEALSILCAWYPMLGGRVEFAKEAAASISFVLATMENTGASDFANHERKINWLDLCDVDGELPNKILAGVAPLMTVQLTKLQRGGCALGVVVSQVVTDHGGLQLLMRDWSRLYQDPLAEIPITPPVPECFFGPNQNDAEVSRLMKTLGLMRLEKDLSKQLIQDAKIGLSLIGQRLATRCRERPDHVKLSFTKFQKELLLHAAEHDEEIDHAVSVNEAVMVYVWGLLLDTVQFPEEAKEFLSLLMQVDPRGNVPEHEVAARTFGNCSVSMSIPVNMRGSISTVTTSVHFASQKSLKADRISALVKLDTSIFPDSEDNQVLFNPTVSTENTGCIGEWVYTPPLLAWEQASQAATFGAPLVRCEEGYTGEAVKVCMRVDGGLEVYLTRMDRAYFNGWPETLAKFPYKGVFVDEVLRRHESRCRKIRPPRRSAFNFAMGMVE